LDIFLPCVISSLLISIFYSIYDTDGVLIEDLFKALEENVLSFNYTYSNVSNTILSLSTNLISFISASFISSAKNS